MNRVTQSIVTSAVALSLSATVALAGMPTRSEAKRASKQLQEGNRSLADIVKKAEAKCGGTAIAVSLCSTPSRPETAAEDGTRGASANDANRMAETKGVSGHQDRLEYRVTCLVNDARLKDVYVCAASGDVKTVRNANAHSRYTRQGRQNHRGSRMADASERSAYGERNPNTRDRYAGADDRFSAGPDGYYERLVVWHFVPNDGTRENRDGSNDSQVRTKYDPNAANHHDARSHTQFAQGERSRNPGTNNTSIDQSRPGQMILGSKLLDASVTNNQDQDLGDVEEVVINPNDGKVVYTAVSYGGVLGIGEKHFAIPCSAVDRVTQDKVLVKVQKAEFENNPGFKNSEWPKQGDAKLAHGNAAQAPVMAAEIRKLTDVIGQPLKNEQNTSLGTINDAVVDTGTGQIAYLIVDCAERDGLVAVPCAALEMRNDACMTRINKQKFEQLPTFSEDSHPAWSSTSWNEQMYSQFNIQPYWTSQAKADTID